MPGAGSGGCGVPYRNGIYWVAGILVIVLVGFWASYFSIPGSGPLAFHVHAVTAVAWLLLLAVQHVSIHRRANAFHRQMGLASLALFPLLMLGFAMIIDVSAQRFSSGNEPSMALLGPAFGIGMMVAMAAYLTLFYLALKHRRNVKLHAGYMLATPLILFESPFSRIIGQFLPSLNVIGSEGSQGLLDTIVVANTIAAAFAAFLYLANRPQGAPWLLVIIFTTLQSFVMWFSSAIPGLGAVFSLYARIPTPLTLMLGAGLGIACAWLGWRAGASPSRPTGAIIGAA